MLFRFSKQINNNDFYFRTDVRFFVSKKHFIVNLLNFTWREIILGMFIWKAKSYIFLGC